MSTPRDCGHEWRTERDEGTHDTVQTHTCFKVKGHYPEPHECLSCGQQQEAVDERRQIAEYEADRLITAYGEAMEFVIQHGERGEPRGRRHTRLLENDLTRAHDALLTALLGGVQ